MYCRGCERFLSNIAVAAFVVFLFGETAAVAQDRDHPTTYEPTVESLSQHPVPEWFEDAKLGIFINWGLYSVPAWAPTSAGEYGQDDRKSWFATNPYAEWYWNTMRIEGSPTQRHHRQTYGKSFSYDEFAPAFKDSIQGWSPIPWTELFKDVGARYVVFDTKHHDGFLLWPSHYPNPRKKNWQVERDLVGNLADAVRERDMRFGIYYSGGIDWSFNPEVYLGEGSTNQVIPQSGAYAEYATAHWRELIERYEPSILWNDIAYPSVEKRRQLFTDYYNEFPEGVVNDRWETPVRLVGPYPNSIGYENIEGHEDFTTPEYAQYPNIRRKKWEATRGLGLSFGYNRNTEPKHMLSVDELVDSFVDLVSKNGNLLLNVGPKVDGTIPELQAERLRGLGEWLDTNGKAIFGTRPWVEAEGTTREGIDVRFTEKNGTLYAILLSSAGGEKVVIENLVLKEEAEVQMLGHDEVLAWKQRGHDLEIELPTKIDPSPAHAFKIAPQPWRLIQK